MEEKHLMLGGPARWSATSKKQAAAEGRHTMKLETKKQGNMKMMGFAGFTAREKIRRQPQYIPGRRPPQPFQGPFNRYRDV